jgi:hypothetical protein
LPPLGRNCRYRCAYIADQLRNAWEKAAELLMIAAEDPDGIAAATRQIELALFMQAKMEAAETTHFEHRGGLVSCLRLVLLYSLH